LTSAPREPPAKGIEQRLLQFGKPALGRRDTRPADRPFASRQAPHRSECRDPTIQMRSALPYWASILCRGVAQRRAVGRVARQHLIGQAEKPSSVTISATITWTSRYACRGCGGNAACHSRRPAAMTQNRCCSNHRAALRNWRRTPASAGADDRTARLRQQFVEAATEGMYLHQTLIGAQQATHRAVLEPHPMQAPLAAGRSDDNTPTSAGCAATASGKRADQKRSR
jgi:hypothetical protein